jgi:magnesium transporter
MPNSRRRRRQRSQAGQSPGTLQIAEGAPRPRLRLSRYSADSLAVDEDVALADLGRGLGSPGVRWLEIEGYGDAALFARLEELYRVPRLALEDVLSGSQRPKVEAFESGLFVVLRVPHAIPSGLEIEQFSMFLSGQTLITFVERERSFCSPLQERLQHADSQLRRSDDDYLLYRLVDFAVDRYFPVVDALEARLDALEHAALEDPTSIELRTLYAITDEARTLRRNVLPTRDAVASLRRVQNETFKARTLPYLRDVEDHATALVDQCDSLGDFAGDIRDLVYGSINLRTNHAMRVLAAVTAVFIPLSFITGVYGMNFVHMPELEWRYGYFVVLGVLVLVAVTAWRLLRRRGWIRLDQE